MIIIEQNHTSNSQPSQQIPPTKINTQQSSTHLHNVINPNNFNPTKTLTHKFSSPVLSKSASKKNNSPQKIPLPVKQFQYGSSNINIRKRILSESKLNSPARIDLFKQSRKLDSMPIKIIKQKIEHQQNINSKKFQISNKNQNISKSRFHRNSSNPESFYLTVRNAQFPSSEVGTFLTKKSLVDQFKQRQNAFEPKKRIFQRFNYENYQNYNYKNPYKLHSYYSQANRKQESNKYKFPTTQKYPPNKGSSKNLQIIFCETKFPQFVQKTNHIYEKFMENKSERVNKFQFLTRNQFQNTSRTKKNTNSLNKIKKNVITFQSQNERKLLNNRNATRWSYQTMKTQPQKINCVQTQTKIPYTKNPNPKSTLQRLLQEFKTLEKLSFIQEKQQQGSSLNRNKTQNLNQDPSKTVLVSLIVYKFNFLQNLNKSLRNHLLKSLLECEFVKEDSKISIHDYLKFNRIFISKDASIEQFSLFVLRFLFKNSITPNIEQAQKVISQLTERNKQKLETAVKFFQTFKNQPQISYEILLKKIIQNFQWLLTIIELIKNE